MPYRQTPFAPDEYFHLVNRGNLHCDIFRDDGDKARFLFYLLYFQNNSSPGNINRHVKKFLKNGYFDFEEETGEKDSLVRLISFSLMTNHFHLLVKALTDKGISAYMQKILNGYSKYFNLRYDQSGHLFQGPFRAVHIKDNEQLLYTSAYVHLNQREIGYRGRETEYRWSSFSDFVGENRWGELLDPSIILEQMAGPDRGKSYKKWVEESGAKESTLDDID